MYILKISSRYFFQIFQTSSRCFFQISVDLIWQWRSGLEDVCCSYFEDVFWNVRKMFCKPESECQCHWLFSKVTGPECHSECTDSKTKIFFIWAVVPFILHFLTLACHLYWYSKYFVSESGTHSFYAGGGVRFSVFGFCSAMCYPLDHGTLEQIP